jgi:hypothetical protein
MISAKDELLNTVETFSKAEAERALELLAPLCRPDEFGAAWPGVLNEAAAYIEAAALHNPPAAARLVRELRRLARGGWYAEGETPGGIGIRAGRAEAGVEGEPQPDAVKENHS